MTEPNIAIVVLAAGCSSRLGQAKQLVQLNGISLLRKQCQLALSVANSVYCVLGYESCKMKKELAGVAVTLIENSDWAQGMSSSIQSAVSVVGDKVDAVMFILVDQWQLDSQDLMNVIEAHRTKPEHIIQATFKETEGDKRGSFITSPPVVFPKSLFTKLMSIKGVNGAKTVVQQYPLSTIKVTINNAKADLDTPEQLEDMLKQTHKYK